MKRYESLCKSFLEAWGKEAQVMMALEEMSELSKELLKDINRKQCNRDNIVAEMADVLILMEQLKYIYGVGEDEIHAVLKVKTAKGKAYLDKWRAEHP